MSRITIILGPQGSGKSQRAKAEAAETGVFVTIGWSDCRSRFKPFLADHPSTVIVEECPHPLNWNRDEWDAVRRIIECDALHFEPQGKEPQSMPTPRFILVLQAGAECNRYINETYFDVIRLGRGGPGRGQGRHREPNPRSFRSTQRYTEVERRLLEGVAGGRGAVGGFIHDAALDRAQQFADAGAVPEPPAPPAKRIIKEGVGYV